jgi:hypothetical protein
MLFRGSLKKCVEAAANLFQARNYDVLTIICCPKAKYYFVCDDDYLSNQKDDHTTSDHRITFRGTRRELETIASRRQTDLFKEESVAHDSHAV